MAQNKLNSYLDLLLKGENEDQPYGQLSDHEIDCLLADKDFQKSLQAQTLIDDAIGQHLNAPIDLDFSQKIMNKIQQDPTFVLSSLPKEQKVQLHHSEQQAAANEETYVHKIPLYQKASVWATAACAVFVVSTWMMMSAPDESALTANINPPVATNTLAQISSVSSDVSLADVNAITEAPRIPNQSARPAAYEIPAVVESDVASSIADNQKLDQPLPEGEWERRLGVYLNRYHEEAGSTIIPYTRTVQYISNAE